MRNISQKPNTFNHFGFGNGKGGCLVQILRNDASSFIANCHGYLPVSEWIKSSRTLIISSARRKENLETKLEKNYQ